jgi:prepilin-type N-terminal cleavage/methylation domain-containing protein
MNKMQTRAGFTLVETLIALALLGVVLTAVAIPLLNFNKLNITSQQTLTETTSAQRELEAARTFVVANYNNPLLLVTAQLNNVTCINLNALGSPMPLANQACPTLTNPSMRRLTITKTVAGASAPVTLSLDVRP